MGKPGKAKSAKETAGSGKEKDHPPVGKNPEESLVREPNPDEMPLPVGSPERPPQEHSVLRIKDCQKQADRPGHMMCQPEAEEPEVLERQLARVSGSNSLDFQQGLVSQLGNAAGGEGDVLLGRLNAMLAAATGIRPKDEIEGMLAAQISAVHELAMRGLAGVSRNEGKENWYPLYVGQATRLLRTFAVLVEALKKYRSRGEQKVIVEHVHVNAGGQAIVGHVEGGGRGQE
jgi:hypothetical protein